MLDFAHSDARYSSTRRLMRVEGSRAVDVSDGSARKADGTFAAADAHWPQMQTQAAGVNPTEPTAKVTNCDY
jgi:hypothetical protein